MIHSTTSTSAIEWFASVLCAVGVATLARSLSTIDSLSLPRGGVRGENRRLALKSSVFRAIDPPLRFGAGVVNHLLLELKSYPRLRTLAERMLKSQKKLVVTAGQPAGLHALEVLAMSLALGLLSAAIGSHYGTASGGSAWVLPMAIVGGLVPNVRLQALAGQRLEEIARELPGAVDLIALAMNAGADFPGAIRRVIAGQKGAVADELGHVLRSLDLGITRQAALLALQERAPVDEVRDLVRAVVLAEKKGASITEALTQQARSSRQRRSVRAEEAAARAGVLLLVPLMLLMGCIMILLIGPLMTSGAAL